MKSRCLNQRHHEYDNYGGRGITVCERWLNSFPNFLADMGPRPEGKTIDRFPNNNGNYEPGNCRWANAIEQANNRRNSRRIEFNGEALTLIEWAHRTGIRSATIERRIYERGWDAERALTCSLRNQKGELHV